MRFLLSTCCVMLTLAAAASAQTVVRIGTEGLYPPFNFINEKNELDGFEIELGNEICARAGLTCEWVINDWDTIIPNLVAGTYDVIMAGMNATEARAQVIAFGEAYKRPDPSAYMALAGTDPSVIETGVIAAQSNTVQAGMVAESGATLLEFPTPDETIAAVRAGVADAVLADRDFLLPYLESSGGEFEFIGLVMPPGAGVSPGFRQSDVELRERFSTVIRTMKVDGSLNALLVKWFGADVPLFE